MFLLWVPATLFNYMLIMVLVKFSPLDLYLAVL